MKVKGYGDVFLAGKFNLKKILRFFSEFLIGVFIYSVRIFGGHPFSYAAASLGSLPLFLGCVFCAVFTGEDPVRITFALIAVFVIKKFVMPKFTFPEYVKVFISSLWGVLLAEILGAIIYNYTFYENFLFALSGIIGAVSSIAMEYAVSKENQKSGASNLYFISMIFFVSIVLCGMGASGRLLNNASIILTIFIILCLSSMSSLFYTASFSVIVGGCMCVINSESLYLLALFVIGGIISSLLNGFSRFVSPLGFLCADLSFLIYTGFDGASVMLTIYTVVASFLFVVVKDKGKEQFLSFFISILPANPGKKYRIKKSETKVSNIEDAEKLCDDCPKKLVCWSENFSSTKDSFNKITSGAAASVSDGFWDSCVKRKELRNLCGLDFDGKDLFRVEISKASSAKMGEKLCGDSVGNFISEDGREIVYIVDGMGTGDEASAQSRKGSNIIKKLTDNGVEERDALKILNEFLTREKSEVIMGIDMLCVDRKNGVAEFYKAGAAPSYIIRRGSSYEIGTASLPIGILDEVNIEYNKCKLMKGDTIIMISDGFLSLGPAVFEDSLYNMKISESDSPVDISEKIMRAAEKMGLLFKDDITVVSMRIY